MSSFMFNFCFVVSWILPRLVSHLSIMRLSSPTLPESISLDTLPGWIGILRGPRCCYLLDSLVFELIVTVGKEVEKETPKGNHRTFA